MSDDEPRYYVVYRLRDGTHYTGQTPYRSRERAFYGIWEHEPWGMYALYLISVRPKSSATRPTGEQHD